MKFDFIAFFASDGMSRLRLKARKRRIQMDQPNIGVKAELIFKALAGESVEATCVKCDVLDARPVRL